MKQKIKYIFKKNPSSNLNISESNQIDKIHISDPIEQQIVTDKFI